MEHEGKGGLRLRWKVLIGLAVVLLLAAVAHGVWLLRAQASLTAAFAAVRAAGEPLTAAGLSSPADDVPDADNASLDDKRAAGLLHPGSADWRWYDDLTPAGLPRPPWTADEQARITALCDGERPALAAAADVRGKRPGSWQDAIDPTDLIPTLAYGFNGARGLCDLLDVSAEDAAVTGDGSAAVDRLGDAVSLADAAERRPTLVGHLVAVAMTRAAAGAVERTMPWVTVTPGNRPAVVALLARLQDEQPLRAGQTLEWRCERLAGTRLLVAIADNRLAATGPAVAPVGGLQRVPALLYVVRPLLLTDIARYVEHLSGTQRAAAAADWPAARAALPTALPAAEAAHPMVHLFVRMLTPAYDKAVKADFVALSARRLAATAVAARLFAADHGGNVPAGWADLVPAYLPAVPTDAVDGRPLRWAEGPPRVYGVGEDERDDGGRPVDELAPMSKRHGDDVAYLTVVPRPKRP